MTSTLGRLLVEGRRPAQGEGAPRPASVEKAVGPQMQSGGGLEVAAHSAGRGSPGKSLTRTTKAAVLGVAGELETYAMMTVDLLAGVFKFMERDGVLVTRRGFLSYLKTFRLGLDDLAGKRVLDMGTGRSRFVQTANAVLGDTGTRAVGIDRFARPPGAHKLPFVQADAFRLPFAANTFDYVLSNWFFCLFMPDLTAPRFTAEKKASLNKLVDQTVEVARGEVRVSFSLLHLGLGGVDYVRDRFAQHPDVAKVEVRYPMPWMGYIRAVKREPVVTGTR